MTIDLPVRGFPRPRPRSRRCPVGAGATLIWMKGSGKRLAPVSALLLGIMLLLTSWPASARHTTLRRSDPREDAYVDVWRSSQVRIHHGADRMLFRVSGSLGPDRTVGVFLDTRGGPRPEYRLWHWENLGPRRCGGHRIGGGRIERLRCEILVNCCTAPGVLRWSMPRKALTPNKQIRWRIHTHYPGDTDDQRDDFAPDIGWYP
jgi:hypothetical protein